MELSPAGISAFHASQLQEKVGIAVLKKSLDAAELQGQAVVSLIDAASDVAPQHAKSSDHKIDVVA